MKANELRIGNIVREGIIDAILFSEQMRKCEVIDGKGVRRFEFIDLMQPIPLTEEWLLRFGFKCNYKEITNQTFYSLVLNSEFNIYYNLTKNKLSLDKKYVGNIYCQDIKHVHQLQNLYFALTEEELTLNNK